MTPSFEHSLFEAYQVWSLPILGVILMIPGQIATISLSIIPKPKCFVHFGWLFLLNYHGFSKNSLPKRFAPKTKNCPEKSNADIGLASSRLGTSRHLVIKLAVGLDQTPPPSSWKSSNPWVFVRSIWHMRAPEKRATWQTTAGHSGTPSKWPFMAYKWEWS